MNLLANSSSRAYDVLVAAFGPPASLAVASETGSGDIQAVPCIPVSLGSGSAFYGSSASPGETGLPADSVVHWMSYPSDLVVSGDWIQLWSTVYARSS